MDTKGGGEDGSSDTQRDDLARGDRTAVLARLGDHIRLIQDPDGLAYAAAELLGRTLQVSRAGYGTIDTAAETITIERDWNAPGITSLAGVLQFRDYGSYIENLKRGNTDLPIHLTRDSGNDMIHIFLLNDFRDARFWLFSGWNSFQRVRQKLQFVRDSDSNSGAAKIESQDPIHIFGRARPPGAPCPIVIVVPAEVCRLDL